MKIREVYAFLGRTVDIRPYYSRTYKLALTGEIMPDEDYQACHQQLIDELDQKLDQLEYQARQQANPKQQRPPAPQQRPVAYIAKPPVRMINEEDARRQAQDEVARLIEQIPPSEQPQLSDGIINRLGNTLQRLGWANLDDLPSVASLLLNREVGEVWDIQEHEAQAIVMWLDGAVPETIDVLWPVEGGGQ